MKKSGVVIGLLLIALIMLFMMQRRAQSDLRQQNDLLRAQLEQLQNDNASLSNSLAQAQSSPPATDQSRELARLRNQLGLLRQRTNELERSRAEKPRLQTQTIVTQNQTEPLSPEDQFHLDQIHRVNALRQLALAMYTFSVDNQNRFATNFDQLTNELGSHTNFSGIPLDSFEFVNPGVASRDTPDLIMFWEKTPRQTTDGKWIRIYGMADGSVQTHISDDGNFDDYEKPHLGPPAAQ